MIFYLFTKFYIFVYKIYINNSDWYGIEEKTRNLLLDFASRIEVDL